MSWSSSYTKEAVIKLSVTESNPTEPITLQELKDHLKIDFEDYDEYLTFLIPACRKELEKYLALSIVDKTITAVMDLNGEGLLPNGPVKAITSVKRITGSYLSTLDTGDYSITGDYINAGTGRVEIVYTVGMDEVDEDIKMQLMILCAYRNEHKGDELMVGIDKIVGTANRNMSWV